MDQDGEPFELPTDNQLRYPKVGWHLLECLAELVLLKVRVVESLLVYLTLESGLDRLFDELFVLRAA